MPNPNPFGTPLLVAPDPETLREIAQVSGGKAFTAEDSDSLKSIYKTLGSQLGTKTQKKQITASFAIGGLVLLLGAGVLARCAGPGACPSRPPDSGAQAGARAVEQSGDASSPALAALAPAVPMPRRITLRWKLAGLLIFIAVLLVALTMVSLASLAKVSDGGRHNFTHVTQPLAALGTARALVNENAGAGRPPHPRGHARDQAPARAAHPGQRPPHRARARAGRAHLHHRRRSAGARASWSTTSRPTAA